MAPSAFADFEGNSRWRRLTGELDGCDLNGTAYQRMLYFRHLRAEDELLRLPRTGLQERARRIGARNVPLLGRRNDHAARS
jgi:hypothetical protein